MIEVSVNGDIRYLSGGVTVDALVDELGCGRKGVAVAVNAEVVPRSKWSTTEVASGDQVEVLHAVQGG